MFNFELLEQVEVLILKFLPVMVLFLVQNIVSTSRKGFVVATEVAWRSLITGADRANKKCWTVLSQIDQKLYWSGMGRTQSLAL